MDQGTQFQNLQDEATRHLTLGRIFHPLGGRAMTHGEYRDLVNRAPESGMITRDFLRAHLDNDREELDSALRTPHDELVQHALKNHLSTAANGAGFSGSYLDMAAGRALRTEISKAGRPNPVTLYSGAAHHPAESRLGYHPFSESKDVANDFAGIRRSSGATGRLWIAQPGQVRGLRVEDYRPSYGGEQEWLIDSSSARGLK